MHHVFCSLFEVFFVFVSISLSEVKDKMSGGKKSGWKKESKAVHLVLAWSYGHWFMGNRESWDVKEKIASKDDRARLKLQLVDAPKSKLELRDRVRETDK